MQRFSTINPEILGLIEDSCQAAGGSATLAVPVAAAWRALHIAARLLDDAEDGDSAHWQEGAQASARLINLGTGFISIANLALVQWENDLTSAQRLAQSRRFSQIVLFMAGGQHLDLLPEGVETIDAYWQHTRGKSGAFFGLATEAGAGCVITDAETLARYYKFGYNLGVALQLVNDLNGFFQEDGHSDLASGKRTLPFFFVTEFAPASVQIAVKTLLGEAPRSSDARRRLRVIAREHGADAYMLAEIARHVGLARHSLHPEDDPNGHLAAYLQRWLKVPDDYLAQ